MTTYVAWDGQEYPLPPPEGWYLATDQRWWPEGHGPGPAGSDAAGSNAADSNAADSNAAESVPPALRGPRRSVGRSSDHDEDDHEEDGERSDRQDSDPAGAAPPVAGPPSDAEPRDPMQQFPKRKRSLARVKSLLLIAFGLAAVGAAAVLVFSAARTSDDPEPSALDTTTSIPFDSSSSTTADPDAETTTTVPGKGSPQDPYVIGETIRLSYDDITEGAERVWEVEVAGPPVDRTAAVLEDNQFNEPPPEGSRFVLVPLRITYVSGPAPASLFDLNFKVVGPSAVVLNTFDPSCGPVPDGLDVLTEVFPGGVVEGNVCWVVPADDIDDLTMLIEVFVAEGDTVVDLTSQES